jgi:hypothetical protein
MTPLTDRDLTEGKKKTLRDIAGITMRPSPD